MTEFFLVFILAHLIGDFVFQTDKIAYLKARGIRGLLVHCAVVSIVQLTFMSLFGLRGFLAAFFVSIIHFFVDYLKNALNKYFRHFQSFYFLFDQAEHIFIIWVFSTFLYSKPYFITGLISYSTYGIGLIITTYVSSVFAKILVRDLIPAQRTEKFFKKYERLFDMLTGIACFLAFIFNPFLAALFIILLIIIYFKLQKKIWAYNFKPTIIKLSSILVFSYLSYLIVLL